jgi:SWI/SNF-related matrix-associated actin-dependent regulator of chromatin subfamily A member 5
MTLPPEMAALYEKLKSLRSRTDLSVRPSRYLVETFRGFDGGVRPFQLRYYQVQGLLHLLLMNRFILGDDCGLGKTLETLAALGFLWEKNPNGKVIVLTTKSAVTQWAGEFRKFMQGVEVVIFKGTPQKRAKLREHFLGLTGPSVLVMNYALARADFTNLQDWKDYTLVLDECTAVKNPSAQIHKVCKHLATQAQRVWGLTATLIKNHLIEGYGIYKVVAPWVFPMSKTDFMYQFCVTRMQRLPGTRRQVPVVVGYRKKDIVRFKEVIDPFFLGRAKHEVASELPALICHQVDVGLSDAQQTLYAEALSEVLQIGEGDAAESKEVSQLTAIIYCQQIVNHPQLISREGDSLKLNALLEMLSEGDLASEKVIVFSRFRKMIDIIVPALQNLHKDKKDYCVRITGSETPVMREQNQRLFQDPESDTNVICITMAGSDAINLQAAKAIIFYDSPWSAGDYLQILGRMIRIGSAHDSVFAIHLIASQTVDDRVMTVLNTKMGLIEGVLGKKLKGIEDNDFQISQESGTKDLFAALREDAQKLAAKKLS